MNDVTDMDIRIVYVMVFPDGTDVPLDDCKDLRREIEDAIQWLPYGRKCRIGNLVRPQFWLPKRNPRRRALGHVLAYWVSRGELPLEFVDPWYVTNKRYQRRRT
jgi:hypothetical protein